MTKYEHLEDISVIQFLKLIHSLIENKIKVTIVKTGGMFVSQFFKKEAGTTCVVMSSPFIPCASMSMIYSHRHQGCCEVLSTCFAIIINSKS